MKPLVKLIVKDFDKMLKLYEREAHGKLRFSWYIFTFCRT